MPRSALILGIQYLTFQAFPIIFEEGHHFNVQSTGLSFLGMGIGFFIGLACQPFINRCVVLKHSHTLRLTPAALQFPAQAENKIQRRPTT